MAKRLQKSKFKIIQERSGGLVNRYEDNVKNAVNTASQISKYGKNVLKKLSPETNRFRTIKIYDSKNRTSTERFSTQAGGVIVGRSSKIKRKK